MLFLPDLGLVPRPFVGVFEFYKKKLVDVQHQPGVGASEHLQLLPPLLPLLDDVDKGNRADRPRVAPLLAQ